MTPVYCCGFECGQIGSVGQHWNVGGGTASIVTSPVRTGNRSLKSLANNVTAQNVSSTNVIASGTVAVARFYIYFQTLPSADTGLGNFTRGGINFKSSDSKIYAACYGASPILGATGFPVTTGQWYLIDLLVDVHTNPWTCDARVDGNPLGQATRATTASTMTILALGMDTAIVSGEVYYDDVVISATSADYPIGGGYVNHFIPTSDGTHNVAGTGDFQRTLTGTDILNATTTAFQLVDDVPLESGASVDWINLLAPPNATDYVECIFGPASGVLTPVAGPRAVEAIAGIHHAGTGTGNMEIRINDNGTNDVMYTATGVAGVTTVIYKRKHYALAPTGGAWTVASGAGNFKNLRMRFGSPAAVDANPDQYLDCIMIEAEFKEVLGKQLNINQAVNRAATY